MSNVTIPQIEGGQLTAITGAMTIELDDGSNSYYGALKDVFLSMIGSQWLEIADTWTYASATTITVPTNATTRYNVGDKIRIKQGGGYKYYVITTVAATLLTVNGGTDYTVANASITNVAFSKAVNPLDWPAAFGYASTVSGSTGSIGTYAETVYNSCFTTTGRLCTVNIGKQITNKGSWATNVQVLLPIAPSSTFFASGSDNVFAAFQIIANGANTPRALARALGNSTTTTFVSALGASFLGWATVSTNDWIICNITYPF